jgi:hypothetical protein
MLKSCVAVLAAGVIAAAVAMAAEPAKPKTEQPKSRADWPIERVTVIGKRGDPRDWIANQTLRGTEGFSDGSAPADVGIRFEFPWQIYYSPDGKLEARFRRIASRVPHGPMEEVDFVEFGRWRMNEEGDLCQTIPKVGWGTEVCYWLDRRGSRIAMYYADCGAFYRCYPGRLGPEGEMFPGRAFTR